MFYALHTASLGMQAQQMNIDNIAHNLSNVNTTGFKKNRVEFQDLLYDMIRQPVTDENGQAAPTGLYLGLGVRTAATQTMFNAGSLTSTNNPYDVAIVGDGFFKIEVPGQEEPLYTKDGSFKVDSAGTLVTTDGYRVIGVDEIAENATDFTIASDGTVTYKTPDSDDPVEAGRIELARFINPAGLEHVGRNLYRLTAASGEATDWDPEADGSISLEQNYLEASNVQVVDEMVNMILAQRAYETNSKIIQTSDEMLGIVNGLRR
ncbi:MAG: flagellar basal-body rod protein FlgG [Firmicutes bacterium]|nr:flagellar basal-body rod protein FlgG [Bacillota bacterium]